MTYTGDQKNNVFVPNFAPQYSNMVERGGLPGVSLEEPNRVGVWVPLDWLQQRPTARSWQRPQSEPT